MSEKPILTITLTDRPPVRICTTDWPQIASYLDHDGAVECQANHQWWLRVRQHADGRTIVYGAYTGGPGGTRADFRACRAGVLLQKRDMRMSCADDIICSIHAVAQTINCPEIAQYVIADLPAVEI